MSAWDTLVANSSLGSGTAWQHLAAQQGGGVVVNDGIAVEVVEMDVDVQLDDAVIEAALDDAPVEAVANDEVIEVEAA